MFLVSLLVVAFCICFCGLSAIHYLLLHAILSASSTFVFFLFGDFSVSEFYVTTLRTLCSIITPNTFCNFNIVSVSLSTEIGAFGEAEHTLTTERETERPTAFPVIEIQHQLLKYSLGRVLPFQPYMVRWATGTATDTAYE